jgi:branched-chain amino acid transport system substrate-binding protein
MRVAAILKGALLMGAVSLVVGAWPAPSTAQAPIKIGFLSPISGAIAQAGKDMYSGCELYWQEHGMQVAGRKLEVVLEDTEGQPATAVAKLRKLIDSDHVNLLAGVILSNVAYALVPPIEAAGIPTIYPINSADDLTQRKRPKWLVRTGFSAGGNMHPFGEYAAKTLKYKKVVTIGLDYAFGWETVGGFHKSFEDNGGQIIQKIWVPLNIQDYAPYLAQVKRDADAVFVVALGRWSVLFSKQYADSGLKGRIPLIAGGTYSDEHVLSQLGDEAIGVISAHHYSAALDTPANRTFRAAFEKAYSRPPSFYSENCYTGARVIEEAVKAVGGRVEDRAALMAALRRVEIKDAPRGPIKIDAYGNPTQNIYIRKVEKVGGVLQNTVIHTYPAVSQFWTYDPQKFLEQPVYSREFPPCRHC